MIIFGFLYVLKLTNNDGKDAQLNWFPLSEVNKKFCFLVYRWFNQYNLYYFYEFKLFVIWFIHKCYPENTKAYTYHHTKLSGTKQDSSSSFIHYYALVLNMQEILTGRLATFNQSINGIFMFLSISVIFV